MGFYCSAGVMGSNRPPKLLLGPFDTHAESVAAVPVLEAYVREHSKPEEAQWFTFGTAKWTGDGEPPPAPLSMQILGVRSDLTQAYVSKLAADTVCGEPAWHCDLTIDTLRQMLSRCVTPPSEAQLYEVRLLFMRQYYGVRDGDMLVMVPKGQKPNRFGHIRYRAWWAANGEWRPFGVVGREFFGDLEADVEVQERLGFNVLLVETDAQEVAVPTRP